MIVDPLQLPPAILTRIWRIANGQGLRQASVAALAWYHLRGLRKFTQAKTARTLGNDPQVKHFDQATRPGRSPRDLRFEVQQAAGSNPSSPSWPLLLRLLGTDTLRGLLDRAEFQIWSAHRLLTPASSPPAASRSSASAPAPANSPANRTATPTDRQAALHSCPHSNKSHGRKGGRR